MSTQVLRIISIDFIKNAKEYSSIFHKKDIDGVPIVEKITICWLQHFMERHNIVPRFLCGKFQLSPDNLMLLENQIAFHLGNLKREFESGELD